MVAIDYSTSDPYSLYEMDAFNYQAYVDYVEEHKVYLNYSFLYFGKEQTPVKREKTKIPKQIMKKKIICHCRTWQDWNKSL